MTRVIWVSNYVLSVAIGWICAAALTMLSGRLIGPVGRSIRETAREHADRSARREGPYLAPVTALAVVSVLVAGLWLAWSLGDDGLPID